MPNKRYTRFGIKKFQLCDDNGYVLHANIYTGKDITCTVRTVTIVKTLLKEAKQLNKGHRVYTDNFYTKPALAETLLQQKTIPTGTVRANPKGIPEGCKVKLAVGQQASRQKGELLFTSF